MARCSLSSCAICGRQVSRSRVSTGSISGTRDPMNAPCSVRPAGTAAGLTYSILSRQDGRVLTTLDVLPDMFSTIQRAYDAAEEFIGVIDIDPAYHQHHAALRFHPGEGCARANGKVTRFRHAWKYASCMVQPDQISIKRRDVTGLAHAFDP